MNIIDLTLMIASTPGADFDIDQKSYDHYVITFIGEGTDIRQILSDLTLPKGVQVYSDGYRLPQGGRIDITVKEPIKENFAVIRERPRSSNVQFLRYYTNTNILQVGFWSRKVYEYYDITPDIWEDIRSGNAVCRTEGTNRFGEWFVGKTPSAGAAVHQYLVRKNVRYRQL